MADVISEYRALQSKVDAAAAEVVRSEERLAAAQAEAQALAVQSKEMGFNSFDELQAAREALEAELEAAVEKLKEAVS